MYRGVSRMERYGPAIRAILVSNLDGNHGSSAVLVRNSSA